PGYAALLLALGRHGRFHSTHRTILVLLLLAHAGVHLYYKNAARKDFAALDGILRLAQPGSSLIELNSTLNFPRGPKSRVNFYSHFGSYYIVRGGHIVDGLSNCGTNRNTMYFCFKDPARRISDYRA